MKRLLQRGCNIKWKAGNAPVIFENSEFD